MVSRAYVRWNAFNGAHRVRGLYEIFKKYPRAITFLRSIYVEAANLWYYGLDEGIEAVQATKGFQRGDALAAWAYAMTV